jgi:hypothetical protein
MANGQPSRRSDGANVNDAPVALRARPVKLRIAASMLHHERGGSRRDSMRGPEYLQRLNEAAAALSGVADIYRLQSGALVRIPREELHGAEYLDGGNILRTATGMLYRPLAMRRAEAIGAITLLAREEAQNARR